VFGLSNDKDIDGIALRESIINGLYLAFSVIDVLMVRCPTTSAGKT
jgi:hypothetical protein